MSRRPVPVMIDGQSYPSLTAAARALGVSDQVIARRAGRPVTPRPATPNPQTQDWTTIDLNEPLRALRTLAGLSLSAAARACGYAGHTSIQGLERHEGGPEGQSSTLSTITRIAYAYGFEVRIQVRRHTVER